MQIRIYQESDEQEVIALWNAVLPDSAPHNDPVVVIRRKRAVDQDLFFVATVDEAVVGTVMGGYDGHRGWIYAVAVDPAHQRQGIGSALLRHVEVALKGRGCLKVNLQVRASNAEVIAFYAALGYELEERASLGKRLYSSAEEVQAEMEALTTPYGVGLPVRMEFPDHVRTRPGMYVGGVDLFGFHQYLIFVIQLLFDYEATSITLTVSGNCFEFASNASLQLERMEEGFIPFERPFPSRSRDGYVGCIVNALSRELVVSTTSGQQREELYFERGIQTLYRSLPARKEATGTNLRFLPDRDIFTYTHIDPAIMASYFRRLSFLRPGVRFALCVEGEKQVFHSENGLLDFFTAVSSPYQLMHAPIRISHREAGLKMELILAYHSGNDDYVWGIINDGLPPDGGTHEKGLKRALKRLRKRLGLSERWFNGGAIAVMTLHCPELDWRGSTKRQVVNPDLKERVSKVVFTEVIGWLERHPEIALQIDRLKTDHFPAD